MYYITVVQLSQQSLYYGLSVGIKGTPKMPTGVKISSYDQRKPSYGYKTIETLHVQYVRCNVFCFYVNVRYINYMKLIFNTHTVYQEEPNR